MAGTSTYDSHTQQFWYITAFYVVIFYLEIKICLYQWICI